MKWRRGRDSNPCEPKAHWLACPPIYYEDLEASAITTPPPRLEIEDYTCCLKTFSVIPCQSELPRKTSNQNIERQPFALTRKSSYNQILSRKVSGSIWFD